MGTIENGKICPTCNQNQKNCIGHFGFIELNEPIIHPLFYKEVREILSFFCIKCYRLLITKEHIKLHSLGKSKIRKILKDRKFEECSHCEHPQPEFKYLPTENSISMVYKQKTGKVSIVLTVEEIKTTLDNIIDEDLEILGIKPNLNHPKNMIMTVFPVIPTTCRPWVIADGNYCDDDLTNQLIEIIKSNNYLSKDEPNMSESKRQKHLQSLKFRIATFYNNSCLDPETPVLMWKGGYKKAKEIVVEDELIGDDGEKRIVLKTCEGEDEMYEITQDKGEKYIVNKNHILSLMYTAHKKFGWISPSKAYPKGAWLIKWFDITNYKLKYTYITVNNERTKEEAYEEMIKCRDKIDDNNIFDIEVKKYVTLPENIKKCLFGFRLSTPIQWKTKKVDIDPYILGLWLGDGRRGHPVNPWVGKGFTPYFTSADKELIEYWENWADDNGCDVVL
jgi:hypothetical protein